MKMIHGLLSVRTLNRERKTALFVDEKRRHLLAFSIIVITMELIMHSRPDMVDFSRGYFALFSIGFFFLYSVLDFVFSYFVKAKVATVLSVVPGVLLLLLFLFRFNQVNLYIQIAVAAAIVLRQLIMLLPHRDGLVLYGCFVLDLVAIYLRFVDKQLMGTYLTDKLLFVALVVMTMSAIQKLIFEGSGVGFPFYYFLLIGIFLLVLPMRQEPIDWSVFVEASQTAIEKLVEAKDNAEYYLSSFFSSDSYVSGYSNLNVTGEKITASEKPQIELETLDQPYVRFTDEATGQKMRMRKVLYLSGGKGADKGQLISFLQFLYANDVDKDYAELFSRVARIDLQYVYIDTFDEIAPNNTFILTADGEDITEGFGTTEHKKGYELSAVYMDIDYGSPYLMDLMNNSGPQANHESLSFQQADEYMSELYDISLSSFITEEEYQELVNREVETEYLDTTGTSDRMKSLAAEITAGASSDYEKCKAIEEYLRQFTYDTDAVGGYNADSSMSTPEGMADIADRFLFETHSGYCVHYTSAMIMLLRLSGIPAKAEVGYRYGFPFERAESYTVPANCAHTWPVAYIENVGWVLFEPTSTYTTAESYTWHKQAKNGDVSTNDYNYEPEEETTEESQNTERQVDGHSIIKLLAIVVVSILVLIGLIIWGTIALRKYRYKHANPEEKLKMDVEIIKKYILKHSKEQLTDRGLLSDYISIAPEPIQGDLDKVFKAYYRTIYGARDKAKVKQKESDLAMEVVDYLKTSRGPGKEKGVGPVGR